jgi:2-oxoglutarate ferredoxin oxidoreductase subunit beta
MQLAKAIQKGLENEGFSFIEVVSQCPTYFGRKNKMKTPLAMHQWIKENSINKRRAEKMEEEELEGKIIVGEFANKPHDELCSNLKKLVEETSGKPLAIKSAFEELD